MLLTIAIVAAIAFVVVTYNKIIKMRNHANEAWSDIDVQLKRRYNLIPNLVETVKGYAEHEEGVFTKVTEARSNAINAGDMKEQAQAENMLSGALKSLFAVAENYPDLKANENFMQLQNELVDTEDKIQAARRFYNGTVRDFNTTIQKFPNTLIASTFKFEAKEFFEVEDEEQKKNVEVSFDKDKKEVKEEAPTPAEAPAEAPAEPAPATPEAPAEPETPAEPAKCEKCGGEMTEGHTCPMPEKTEEEKPAEPEAPKEEETPAETPAEPAKCEKCGGEMTEDHTCPVTEPPKEEEAPTMPVVEEKKEEEKPAEETAPVEEKPAEEKAEETPAKPDAPTMPVIEEKVEEKPAEEKAEETPAKPETPALPIEEAPAKEEKKEGDEEKTA